MSIDFKFKKITYSELNACQKENYNFQKLAAHLADYGFNCMWLNDDWQGADFIACHIDGEMFLKVQLKGRLTFDAKYKDKEIYVAFRESNQWYLYPHDTLCSELISLGFMKDSKSWVEDGVYSWPKLPKDLLTYLEKYLVLNLEKDR